MSDRIAIGLDNAAFDGRLRKARSGLAVPVEPQPQTVVADVSIQVDTPVPSVPIPATTTELPVEPVVPAPPQPALAPASPVISEMVSAAAPAVPVMTAEPYAKPAQARLQPSAVLMRSAAPQATDQPEHVIVNEPLEQPPTQPVVAGKERSEPALTRPDSASIVTNTSKRSTGALPKVMFGVACLVFVVGLGVSIRTQQTNQSAAAQFAALTEEIRSQSGRAGAASSAARPAAPAAAATSTESNAVADDEPSTIQIPKINLDTKVQAVALTDQGKLQLPSDFRSAGWYSASAKPGQPGAMVVHGQMSAGTSYGPFHRASELVAGDTITVLRGDKTSVVYRVSSIQQLSANQDSLSTAKVPQTAGKNGLSIIATAPGGANPIIVSAEQQ